MPALQGAMFTGGDTKARDTKNRVIVVQKRVRKPGRQPGN